GSIVTEEEGMFELQWNLNLSSAYYISRKIIPGMQAESMVFNICSTASVVAYSNGGSYCISKHALYGMSKVLREELKSSRIGVCSVLPGATYTESWSGTDLPEQRFMRPEDIAEMVWAAWSIRKTCVVEELIMRPVLGDI